jgi:hypothetical protein
MYSNSGPTAVILVLGIAMSLSMEQGTGAVKSIPELQRLNQIGHQFYHKNLPDPLGRLLMTGQDDYGKQGIAKLVISQLSSIRCGFSKPKGRSSGRRSPGGSR